MSPEEVRRIRKYLLIILAGLSICLVGALIFTYWYVPQNESKSLNFQAYAPQKLPSGVRLTVHSTTVRFGGVVKYVDFSTNLTGFHISEQKMSQRDYTGTFGSCNFKRGTGSCTSHQTPQKTAYHVLTVANGLGTPTLQTVYWYLNGTELEFNLLDSQAHQYSPDSWGPIVDSFTPVDYGYERGTTVNSSGG